MVFRKGSSRFLVYHVLFFVFCAIGWAAGDTIKKPDPLLVEPSQTFEGNDGPWSTFNARVGSPPQPVRLLVSTASAQTMVVLSQSCDANVVGTSGPPACAQSRGQMFNPNTSTTWNEQSTFAINTNGIGFEANLGYKQVALFGLESLGLGLTGSTLANMTVAGGIFGLGTQPVNYSTLGNISAPSYITTLKDQNLIPNLGWSYTAGAPYRLKKVLGQLIFGGYDTSRQILNTASFDLAQDQDRDVVVSIQEIVAYRANQTTLLPSPIYAFIDSTDPLIWLPDSAIKLFEQAFSLKLDEASNRYLITESQHAELVAMDPSVTFRIANSLTGGEVVDIKLPYSAFDLWLDWPYVANKTRYFPLMRADNETQYTLGRTFLQEAYLTVNHEYRNFTVSQCAWTDEALTPNIKSLPSKPNPSDPSSTVIPPGGNTPSNPTENPHNLPTGAIVGVIIGGIVLLLVSSLAIWLLVTRKRKAKSEADTNSSLDNDKASLPPDPPSELTGLSKAHEISDENSCITTAELSAGQHSNSSRQELHTTSIQRSELEHSPRSELGDSLHSPRSELEHSPRSELGSPNSPRSELGHSPRSELGSPHSPRSELENPPASRGNSQRSLGHNLSPAMLHGNSSGRLSMVSSYNVSSEAVGENNHSTPASAGYGVTGVGRGYLGDDGREISELVGSEVPLAQLP
ncbi:hypothetical protein HYFRA_00005438 [Hymenoscyphus fraxineus]|uniref:Peptidase A1 domain-containing protein n=1 Tax=Hymenoscyphus fraxineus TaxID=746836 RepID=A0A9N9PQN2_9HELO|nr:hypothetical protein HYFRA_00005438 [Hymenoscyphus fraxineus]